MRVSTALTYQPVAGIDRGETLDDLIAALRVAGVTGQTPIRFCDFGTGRFEQGFISVEFDEDGYAEIRGVR